MKLEKMDKFFDSRLDGYDAHMMTNIASAEEFYPFTAGLLPRNPDAHILDLGCGTGLELEYYFVLNPTARITGIDLAEGMLGALRAKFPEKQLNLILGSYFEVPLGCGIFDAAVSVESLHHFTQGEKTSLYAGIFAALKAGGCFVLTDYFALSEEEEDFHRAELARLKREQGLPEDEFYHYDTPLTVEHEMEALHRAGFETVEVLGCWGATHTIRARKEQGYEIQHS